MKTTFSAGFSEDQIDHQIVRATNHEGGIQNPDINGVYPRLSIRG
jgi:hypothetical protein